MGRDVFDEYEDDAYRVGFGDCDFDKTKIARTVVRSGLYDRDPVEAARCQPVVRMKRPAAWNGRRGDRGAVLLLDGRFVRADRFGLEPVEQLRQEAQADPS